MTIIPFIFPKYRFFPSLHGKMENFYWLHQRHLLKIWRVNSSSIFHLPFFRRRLPRVTRATHSPPQADTFDISHISSPRATATGGFPHPPSPTENRWCFKSVFGFDPNPITFLQEKENPAYFRDHIACMNPKTHHFYLPPKLVLLLFDLFLTGGFCGFSGGFVY